MKKILLLDLEGTLIQSELNPLLLDYNKNLIDNVYHDFNISEVYIFSMMYCDESENPSEKFISDLEKHFNVTINGVIKLGYLFDMHSTSEFKKDVNNKETLFKIYISTLSPDINTVILIDDTVKNNAFNINSINGITIRGNTETYKNNIVGGV